MSGVDLLVVGAAIAFMVTLWLMWALVMYGLPAIISLLKRRNAARSSAASTALSLTTIGH